MNRIEEAVSHFRTLLEKQLERAGRMENAAPAKVFDAGTPVTVGLVPGDGIGPVIMAEARRVIDELLKEELATGTLTVRPIEGLTLERRLALGQPVP